MTTLAFPAPLLYRMRLELLRAAPKEAAAIVLAGHARAGSTLRLLAREVFPVPAHAYAVQEEYRLQIEPVFIASILKRARIGGWSLIFVHTHPFAESARFSTVDDEGEAILLPSIFARAPGGVHGSLVLTSSSFDARLYPSSTDSPVEIDQLIEVGPALVVSRRTTPALEIEEQFDRSVRALGEAGQKALGLSSVAVVGLGGIGSIVSQMLSHLGMGRLILIDDDDLDVTNLNRVVGATREDVGRAKVAIAADHAKRIRASIAVEAHRESAIRASIGRHLLSADAIVCCTDTHGSRAVLNQFAYQYLIPVVDIGVRIDIDASGQAMPSGRVQMLAPGLPCLVCQNTLDSDHVRRDLMTEEARKQDPYIVGAQQPQPAVISLNSTAASLAVTMLLSALVGFPTKTRHQIYQGLPGSVRPIASEPVPTCVVCSIDGALGRGDLWPMPWRRD